MHIENERRGYMRRLRKFDSVSSDVENELKELAIQLRQLDENIAALPEGVIKEEHIRVRTRLDLRNRSLLNRAPEYTKETRDAKQQTVDALGKTVEYWDGVIEGLKARKAELEGEKGARGEGKVVPR